MSNINYLMPNRRPQILTLIDIGTQKTSCLMVDILPVGGAALAVPAPDNVALSSVGLDGRSGYSINVLGAAHQSSKGIKAGVVVDVDGVEGTLKSVIGAVEKISGIDVDDLVLSVSCGRLRSDNFRATTPFEGKSVSRRDIGRLTDAGRSFAERDGRVLVHSNHVGFSIDDEMGIIEPIGMAGEKLTQELHMVTADGGPLKNLLLAVERSYFNVVGVIPSTYGSAEAVLSMEEKRLGAIALDLGGGTSSFAVYGDGHFIHMDGITVGGDHITYDIARSLSTPLHVAERIKTLYGSVINASSDECEMIAYPNLNNGISVMQNISKASLGRIIRPRVEEIISLIQERLVASKLAGYAGDRIVLTGGASQLQGIAEFSAHLLGKSVRIGSPLALENMPGDMTGPAFANLIGQALVASNGQGEFGCGLQLSDHGAGHGYFANVGNWLRESF